MIVTTSQTKPSILYVYFRVENSLESNSVRKSKILFNCSKSNIVIRQKVMSHSFRENFLGKVIDTFNHFRSSANWPFSLPWAVDIKKTLKKCWGRKITSNNILGITSIARRNKFVQPYLNIFDWTCHRQTIGVFYRAMVLKVLKVTPNLVDLMLFCL